MSGFPKWDEKIIMEHLTPKWALPKNIRTNKLHCFVDSESLCNSYNEYIVDSVEESCIVYERPNTVCRKCFVRWKKQYQTEGS
jgi:uncharacterized phage-like protein YoqJ